LITLLKRLIIDQNRHGFEARRLQEDAATWFQEMDLARFVTGELLDQVLSRKFLTGKSALGTSWNFHRRAFQALRGVAEIVSLP